MVRYLWPKRHFVIRAPKTGGKGLVYARAGYDISKEEVNRRI
jgi:hypothetical protein